MVGFIKGLLGNKQPVEKEPVQQPEPKPAVVKQKPQAYFLDAAEAKTLGNLEYMQTARSVTRSFPSTASGKGKVVTVEISSMQLTPQQRAQVALAQAVKADGASVPTPVESAADGAAVPQPEPLQERRRSDDSLDRFRAMARDVGKTTRK